jgi:hypothetical protein
LSRSFFICGCDKMIRAPDEYRRETLAGPSPIGSYDREMDPLLEETLAESRRLHERRQQRMAEFAPLLSKLKRIGFYDTIVHTQYVNIQKWCEAYYEERHSPVTISFEALSLIRWTVPERTALDKIKISCMNNTA